MASVMRTACNRDCPDACGVLATVEEGRVTSIRGEKDHPITQGFLCERTKDYLRRQYHSERLTTPLLRVNDELVPVSWDEALDFVSDSLLRIRQESGAEAVLHYKSGGSMGILKCVNDYFFECFGGARVKKGDICSGAGEAAQLADMGVCDSHDHRDMENSRTIFLWGRNLMTSFLHSVPIVNEARRRGASVVLIDPAPGRTARLANRVVRPRPGCDRFLAMGMARELFERGWVADGIDEWSSGLAAFRELAFELTKKEWARAADVSEAEIEELAELCARNTPASIQVGWGLQRRAHGSATIRTLDALGALSGNLGVAGGGVCFEYPRRGAFDVGPYGAPPERRGIQEALLGPGILEAADPPVRAVVIDNGNPVAMLPDSKTVARALQSRELVVVLEQFLTDTTDHAHVVLPVTSMLEEEDMLGAFGHHYLTASQAVADRVGEVKSDFEIYQALAERLGFGDKLSGTPREWAERLLEPVADKVDYESLQKGTVVNPRARTLLFEDKRFVTEDGRFHFVTELNLDVGEQSSDYPLSLGSFSTPQAQSSQWSDPSKRGPYEARCHPDAAAGVADGGLARISSRKASIELPLRYDSDIRPDLVVVPKGGWLKDGLAANSLIDAQLTDMGFGAVYYDERVRIDPVG